MYRYALKLPTVIIFGTPELIIQKLRSSLLKMLLSENPQSAPNDLQTDLDISNATSTLKQFYTYQLCPKFISYDIAPFSED